MKAQNLDEMKFCTHCKMNVFPSRPKFNIKIFILCIFIMLVTFITMTYFVYSLFASFFLFIFIMWGFIVINPYLIFYGVKKKNNCPNCYYELIEKNIEYIPFGEIIPEVFKKIAPEKKPSIEFHCPYCGIALIERAKFCRSCGKKFDILR